ncbi:3'-5' exoribonuclease [Burkholderiaceae bacterium DAT-1]|nr:3'-5' exoribonuclease [Burkholderiaceae bacterium DAT-1]
MMVFLDTEFTGLDAPDPLLISVALVREDGEYLYAEVPPGQYAYRASHWVRENVMVHLWGGSYCQDLDTLALNVQTWLKAIPEQVVILSDAPYYDMERMLKPLLHTWPANLHPQAMLFDRHALGDGLRDLLASERRRYYTHATPEHHALHDAMALRQAWLKAQTLDGFAEYLARLHRAVSGPRPC